MSEEGSFTVYQTPELSDWRCYMFGNRPGGNGFCWTPSKGQEPNWFWRWMQYLIVGNWWEKYR